MRVARPGQVRGANITPDKETGIGNWSEADRHRRLDGCGDQRPHHTGRATNDNVALDGTKRQLFGPNPKGILVLAANGQYAQIIVLPDRPNFKVNNRLNGTPDENTASVHGTTATFGTWSIDEANKTLTVRNEGSMFPNQVGTESKRTITVTGDQLRVSNPNPASGGKSESVWKRGATVASK